MTTTKISPRHPASKLFTKLKKQLHKYVSLKVRSWHTVRGSLYNVSLDGETLRVNVNGFWHTVECPELN